VTGGQSLKPARQRNRTTVGGSHAALPIQWRHGQALWRFQSAISVLILAKATLSRQDGKLKRRQDNLVQNRLPTARDKFAIEGNC
jgi:hypothetical protein